jgi:hypothetical protein
VIHCFCSLASAIRKQLTLFSHVYADKTAKRYVKYGEMVADLRRCFANAVKYNFAHLSSDTTGSSKLVYEAALMMQEKLETLLATFTVNLCERVDRTKITNAENATRNAELRAKQEKEEAEAKKFEQKVRREYFVCNSCSDAAINV